MIGRFSSQAVEGSINRISDLGRGAKCRLANADDDPMDKLRGHSITYRIAVGPQQGRKVFTLQTLPDERDADDAPAVGNVAGLLRASCPPLFGPAFQWSWA